MSDFQRVHLYYQRGWATKQQIAQYVQFGKITPEQYVTIVGETYPTA